jgi:hypothetical protein
MIEGYGGLRGPFVALCAISPGEVCALSALCAISLRPDEFRVFDFGPEGCGPSPSG